MRKLVRVLIVFWVEHARFCCLSWGVFRQQSSVGRLCSRYTPIEFLNVRAVVARATVPRNSPILKHHDDESTYHSTQLEPLARELATTALEAVLPYSNNNKTIVSTEKALKQTLRSLPSNLDATEKRWLRSRLSKLILGTSIMRLRHEYVVNATTSVPTSSFHEKIRAMVDEHDRFLLDQSDALDIEWPHNTVDRLSVMYSFPSFLIEEWINQYGTSNTEQLCIASNQPGPITLRRNSLKCPSNKHLIERIAQDEDGLAVQPLKNLFLHDAETWKPPIESCLRLASQRPHKRSIWSMPCWRDGWFEVQDVGSQLIVYSTDAKAGEVVVDYCAGNGGKTLALASKMFDSGSENSTIWAHDVVEQRLAQIRGSLQRVGLLEKSSSSVEIRTTSNSESDLVPGMADLVLVDAPCSSSGVLRRRPSHRWEMSKEDMRVAFPELQLKVLRLASKLVKPNGGRLVYATCSISKWENQKVVGAWETEQEKNSHDENQWLPWEFDENEWPNSDGTLLPHCRALLPHFHNSDGFFIARWMRK